MSGTTHAKAVLILMEAMTEFLDTVTVGTVDLEPNIEIDEVVLDACMIIAAVAALKVRCTKQQAVARLEEALAYVADDVAMVQRKYTH